MNFKPCICCGELKKHYPLCFHCKLPTSVSLLDRCEICFTPCFEQLCSNCKASPLPWNSLRYLFKYEDIHYLLHRMKFRPSLRIAKFLGGLMSENTHRLFEKTKFDLIIPAPISESSLRTRQFNQSFILAKNISKTLKIPLILALSKSGSTQSSLSENRRRAILKSISFTPRKSLNCQNALFVDDIITTGLTAAACALKLKQNGVQNVSVYSLSSATANEIFPFYLRSSFLKSNAVQVVL